ncbi:alpha/beta hydrolase [Neolewinella antarctica]|uniref:Esterase n=1 Tax=Neolewinella antarctica TaxID=442734 RepID=A0ABX0XFZ2_9BACT|nr:alpha/beta hydrolase-fold protein [Neolewinella antarctica]NJC28241.1 hypothetical protein [Neolewinella antarctica]
MMMHRILFIVLALGFLSCATEAQVGGNSTAFVVKVADKLQKETRPEGRLVIHVKDEAGKSETFGVSIKGLDGGAVTIRSSDNWTNSGDNKFSELTTGRYTVWAEYHQKQYPISDSLPNTLRSEEKAIEFGNGEASLVLTEARREPVLVETDLVHSFEMRSLALSTFHGADVLVKAAVLLPAGYAANPGKRYPIRYNVAGYGGRFTRVQRLVEEQGFMDWYGADEGPNVISVFLDSDGPYGDNYQLNSANSGPFGDALIEELIPAIEADYRVLPGAENRFVDGCSTGGWVSLALMTFYPDSFGAVYSYSPDPVSFNWMQLINLYEDENAFYNRDGYLTPTHRTINGRPTLSVKREVSDENVVSGSGSYTSSKSQWGAWNAVYSGRGADGLPKPVFDPVSGVIDPAVVKEWEKFDLLKHTKENWPTLGPKLAGKVYVWMGDMDNYYLNNALREYDAFLKQATGPASDAVIEFVAMEGHCSLFSQRRVLERIMGR